MTQLRVACIQTSSGADISENIKQCHSLVQNAAGQGAQLVALPENAFLMRDPAQKEAFPLFSQAEHPGVQAACSWARECAVWLLVGSVAVLPDTGATKLLNRSLLISPQGLVVATYDKIHLFDVTLPGGESYAESSRFAAGERMVVVPTPLATLGLSICYDVRFPHLYRAMATAGAQLLMVPAAFTYTTGTAHWEVLLRARAIENGCFVVAPAQTGTHPGDRRTFGHSLIIDPWGRVLANGGTEVGVVLADLDLAQVDEIRTRLPSLAHTRPFS
jgi:deaminated glutathione amidase